MDSTSTISEAEILAQVVAPMEPGLNHEAARFLLKLRFDPATNRRIRQLLQKNNRGIISPDDRITLERYLRVGQLLDLLHAKAKLSLQRGSDSA